MEALAGPLCRAVRDIVGAASVAVFWIDALGVPAGFFHDCAPAELKDFYITRYDELFDWPDQITMLDFIGRTGAPIGTSLEPGFMERWLSGNIHIHLCAPLGHHHVLDMRIDRDGRGCAAFFAWNPEQRPFTARDAAAWEPVRRLIQHAARADATQVRWQPLGDGHGHFLTDPGGTTLIAIHPEAERLLHGSHLLKQNVSVTGPVDSAPAFAAGLARQLAQNGSATLHLPVAKGRLVASASYTRGLGQDGGDAPMMFVLLHLEVARNLLAAEYVLTLPLTPLQREIALFALTGGQRSDCDIEFGVSDEALKKHLRAIFTTTAATRWADLATLALPVERSGAAP